MSLYKFSLPFRSIEIDIIELKYQCQDTLELEALDKLHTQLIRAYKGSYTTLDLSEEIKSDNNVLAIAMADDNVRYCNKVREIQDAIIYTFGV